MDSVNRANSVDSVDSVDSIDSVNSIKTWISTNPTEHPWHYQKHQLVSGPSPSRLPCEFVGYDHCEETFNIDDKDGWISHIIQCHLGNNFPPRCICWFCDEEYVAQSSSTVDCWESYQLRMDHIAEHFRTSNLGVDEIRPDFFFLDHIHRHGLVSKEEYRHATKYRELKQITDLHEASWRPTGQDQGTEVVETSRHDRRHRPKSSRHSNISGRDGESLFSSPSQRGYGYPSTPPEISLQPGAHLEIERTKQPQPGLCIEPIGR